MKRPLVILAGLLTFLLLCSTTVTAQSLADGLDNSGLLWVTNGQAGWRGSANQFVAYDGVDCAESGAIDGDQESVLQTTITNNPGTLTFWWKVSSETNFDYLEFSIVGVLTNVISGVVDWQFRSYDIPSGIQTLRWRYVKNGSVYYAPDKGFLDQVILFPVPPMLLGQALDNTSLTWTSGGNTNTTSWIGLANLAVLGGVTNLAHDGVDSAQNGAIFHRQESWMETTVTGATNVSFWWKVSSEASFDFLEFSIDGVSMSEISGELDWQKKMFTLSTNAQTLRWRYYKDETITEGKDRGWVDQVVVNSGQADPAPFSLTSPTRLPDGRFQLTLSSVEQRNYRILVSTNLTSWSTLTNVTSTNANTTIVDSAASNFTRRFYQGVTP